MTQQKQRPCILIITDYYLPGYKSGGSMRSIVNLVDRIGDKFDIRVITRDHDGKLSREPYNTVDINKWNEISGCQVFYISKENIRPSTVKRLINEVQPEVVYLNSFFSPLTIFALVLRKYRLLPEIPFILAPEGELSLGSMAIKSFRKKLFKRIARIFELHRRIVWKVASEPERKDLERFVGSTEKIFVAPTMTPKKILEDFDIKNKPSKDAGAVRLAFLSRYMRTKNLNWLLEHLQNITSPVEFDIYGPLEDAEYWTAAQRIIDKLPANILVSVKGPVPHDQVAKTLVGYHFFVLPSIGENFGLVIIEAMAAGCPVIISDRTPWRSLEEKGIGWELPLESPEAWIDTINKCIDMPSEKYEKLSGNSRRFAVDWLEDPLLDESNLRVIEYALASAKTD